ncbi:hypothetical protein AZE42_12959 [Rhizopogon vesiculosus]|uniref:Uncharacterized protein n=1 Tax=Rhizopogon vesiculosus TaxID=180088 RepID=A0A1J8PKX8_9AGAM|nr:hypothetical protein AZE42_12959 [Rhizopogon vesiculosus]
MLDGLAATKQLTEWLALPPSPHPFTSTSRWHGMPTSEAWGRIGDDFISTIFIASFPDSPKERRALF